MAYLPRTPQHKVSWSNPRSKHWHQLNLILTRRKGLNTIPSTRSLHSTECDTDHALINAKVNLTPRKLNHSKPKGHLRINPSCASHPLNTRELLDALRASLDKGCGKATNTNAKWKQVCSALYQVGLEVLGRKERKKVDWFEANWQEMDLAM